MRILHLRWTLNDIIVGLLFGIGVFEELGKMNNLRKTDSRPATSIKQSNDHVYVAFAGTCIFKFLGVRPDAAEGKNNSEFVPQPTFMLRFQTL